MSILLKRILYPYFSEGIAIRKIITCSVLLPVLTAIFLSIAMGMDHFWMKQKSLPVFWNGSPGAGGCDAWDGGKACALLIVII